MVATFCGVLIPEFAALLDSNLASRVSWRLLLWSLCVISFIRLHPSLLVEGRLYGHRFGKGSFRFEISE